MHQSPRIVKKAKDWIVNPGERYFLFTDGSFRPEFRGSKRVNIQGMGATMVDSSGKKVLYYAEEKVLGITQKPDKNPEILTLENALDIVYAQGVRRLVLQTDMKGMAQKIDELITVMSMRNEEARNKFYTSTKGIWHNCFEKLSQFDEVFSEFIPRELNTTADFYSRSAYALNEEEIKKQIEQLKKVDVEKKNCKQDFIAGINSLTSTLEGVCNTSNSLQISNMMKLYWSRNQYFPKDWMFFDVRDDIKEKKIVVKISLLLKTKTLIKPVYIPIHLKYGEHKDLALLFLLMSIVTEKSVNLINQLTVKTSKQDFNYKHTLWNISSEMESEEFFEQKNKCFFLDDGLKNLLKVALSKNYVDVLGEFNDSFVNLFDSSKNIIPVNLIHNRSMWKKMIALEDGKNIPVAWTDSNLINSLVLEKNQLKCEKKKPNPPKVKSQPNVVAKPSSTGFSFLEYGLSLQKTNSLQLNV